MAAAALSRSARCHACRHDVLQTFVRTSGFSITQTLRPPNEPQTRRFFTIPNLRNEVSNRQPEVTISQAASALNDSVNSPSAPWYLQVESIETPHPAANRQEIPAVPENAPPITQDMLQYLADEIGLDDMVLLDLRGRDPPSALGVNLIMIIGTARSLKHLNVSADRFCRWLRSTYKLRPYADGLLGRNELKIKLRRKTRRARLASSSGAVADSSDDGITTGWICVNVGSVDDPSNTQNAREGNFEGFGKVQGGTRIVVQMFTEAKRADVDLEKLWAPKRDMKTQDSEAGDGLLVEEEHQVDPTSQSRFSQLIPNIPRPPPHLALDQRRSFSTTTCSRRNNFSLHMAHEEEDDMRDEFDEFHQIYYFLKTIPPTQVRMQLGSGPEDKDSTEFLRESFAFTQEGAGSYRKDSTLRLILASAGVSARHPKYTKEYLWGMFLEHTASGFKVRPRLAMQIADAFVVPRPEGQGKKNSKELIEFDTESALRVLDWLSLRGPKLIQDWRSFNVLYKILILRSQYEDANSIEEKALRIRNLMTTIGGFEWVGEYARETMRLRFQLGDVDGFYEIWHTIPFHERNRTEDDYELLFRLHAEVGNPAHARECLAVWISMMGREDPVITPQNGIISAIARCALVAGRTASELRLTPFPADWQKAHGLIVLEMESLQQNA